MKAFKQSPENKIKTKFGNKIAEETESDGSISIYLVTASGRMKLGNGKTSEDSYKASMAAAGVK